MFKEEGQAILDEQCKIREDELRKMNESFDENLNEY